MSVACTAWALKQPVDTPIQKLTLLALADGCSADPAYMATYFSQPGWDFAAALDWLHNTGLVKLGGGVTYFNVAYPAPRAVWQDRSGTAM